MRAIFAVIHRWAGLLIAGFLFFSGITGAVISWDHELDDLLNPQLTEARAFGPAIPSLELARQIEARHPQVRVSFLALAAEPGESLAFGVDPRVDPATGKLFEPGFNQVFVDPASGAELGKREWGAPWPITQESFVSFLYKLHYTLHIPELWGIDEWGEWLLGTIALVWTLDCFVGFYLTLPARRARRAGTSAAIRAAEAAELIAADDPAPASASWWRRWKPAWKVRWASGSYKRHFDLHRALSLWTWGLLFIVAFTAFSLNLYSEVFHPLMSEVSEVTPSPFDTRTPSGKHQPVEPRIGYAEMIERAREEGARRGWPEPVGSVFYSDSFGIYGAEFFHPGADHGAGGVGHKRLYYDALDGRYLGERQPWRGTAADIFVQAQFPLHSGRILGLPGRILISLMGLVVATLSVTGVVIWLRKRRARQALAATDIRRPGARRGARAASADA